MAPLFPGRTQNQVNERWSKVLNPVLVKGSWTREEDMLIVTWVTEKGTKDWGALAAQLPGRIPKQCRERWHNHLSPDVLKTTWTAEEDKIIIECHKKWGNKWSKIATLMPGRTDNSIKNRWNSSLKRRLERVRAGLDPTTKRGRKPRRTSEAPPMEILDGIKLPEKVELAIASQNESGPHQQRQRPKRLPPPPLPPPPVRAQEPLAKPPTSERITFSPMSFMANGFSTPSWSPSPGMGSFLHWDSGTPSPLKAPQDRHRDFFNIPPPAFD
jgi:hypothetical protein